MIGTKRDPPKKPKYIWPTVQGWIFGIGGLVDKTGVIGTFFFGFILRLLGPFGLNHVHFNF
jgi:PTS system maltose and glucose-specific IIC component